MARSETRKKTVKGRYWAMTVYPESVADGWRDVLRMTGLKCAISPLHDKDIKSDGTDDEKKAHWHVMMCWDGPTTKNAANDTAALVGGVLMPRPVNSVGGYYRYLTHRDDADKHQYDEEDIECLNGFNPSDYIEWTKSELERLKQDVFDLVRSGDFLEYADLMETLRDGDRPELWSVASNHTVFFRAYLSSRRHRYDSGETIVIDKETGEVIVKEAD